MELIQGIRTKLVLVSYSHGSIRVPINQTLNYTPKITERNINEFDNLEIAQVVTTFDGVDVTFDYLDSDSKLVDAMFADVDPDSAVVIDDPSNYQMVNGYANLRGLESGKIVASILFKEARAKGSPYTEPVKEEAKVTRDLSAINVLKIKGQAICYDRFLASGYSGVYVQKVPPNVSTDITMSGASSGWSGALTKTAVGATYSGASGFDLYVLKNGVEVDPAAPDTMLTGTYAMTSGYFTVNEAMKVTDVWEVFYLYTDV